MDRNIFDKEVEYAMSQGITASQSLECIAFMNKHFPEDLRLHSTYYKQWIRRWKEDPLAYMDNDCTMLYNLIQTTTSVFLECI